MQNVIRGKTMEGNEDLIKLGNMLENFIFDAKDDLGGERIQPYIVILEGVRKAISTDLSSDDN